MYRLSCMPKPLHSLRRHMLGIQDATYTTKIPSTTDNNNNNNNNNPNQVTTTTRLKSLAQSTHQLAKSTHALAWQTFQNTKHNMPDLSFRSMQDLVSKQLKQRSTKPTSAVDSTPSTATNNSMTTTKQKVLSKESTSKLPTSGSELLHNAWSSVVSSIPEHLRDPIITQSLAQISAAPKAILARSARTHHVTSCHRMS
jgi:hypothetical protein